jgi:hypothetical protein
VLVEAALAHPLLSRARETWHLDRCRRETPITAVEEDGSISEEVLDLAFEEDTGRTVVDFNTQAELAAPITRHRRQVGAYASFSGSSATGLNRMELSPRRARTGGLGPMATRSASTSMSCSAR